MKKHLIILLLLILSYPLHSYAGIFAYVQPMPMPTQYRSLEQYEQALQVWETVHTNLMTRTAQVQLPPMPTPEQYRHLEQYEQALAIWERMGTAQGAAYPISSNLVRLPPMPMPTQYRKWERYQQALQSWLNVSKNKVAQNHNILPPRMPMPTQYQKIEHYESALQAWKKVFE